MKNTRNILLDKDKCDLCGRCAKSCPFGALKIEKGILKYKAASCLAECQACTLVCPEDALEYQELFCGGGSCGSCAAPEGCAGCKKVCGFAKEQKTEKKK